MQRIESRENPRVREYVRLAANAGHREERGRFVFEGARIVADALDSGAPIEEAFVASSALRRLSPLAERLERAGASVFEVTPPVEAKLACTQTPQGVFCVARMLDKALSLDKINIVGAYLAVEAAQDPGNVGTILRSAEAFGLDGVLLSPGCADLWSPKVVRASMGAVFRLPVFRPADFTDALRALSARGMKTLAAVAGKNARAVTGEDLRGGVVACVGNEGNGLSEACVAACETRVTIPMKGRAESLNAAAAAAVLMWEIEKQR